MLGGVSVIRRVGPALARLEKPTKSVNATHHGCAPTIVVKAPALENGHSKKVVVIIIIITRKQY